MVVAIYCVTESPPLVGEGLHKATPRAYFGFFTAVKHGSTASGIAFLHNLFSTTFMPSLPLESYLQAAERENTQRSYTSVGLATL